MSNGKFGNRLGLTAWVSNTTSQVLPSGGDFATTAAPLEPEAPGRFSTMTVVPSRGCSPAAASRPTASTEAPAGNGTMIRIGPAGQFCACAVSGASIAPSTTDRLVSLAIGVSPRSPRCVAGYNPRPGVAQG